MQKVKQNKFRKYSKLNIATFCKLIDRIASYSTNKYKKYTSQYTLLTWFGLNSQTVLETWMGTM